MPTIKEQCEKRIRELLPELRVRKTIMEQPVRYDKEIHLEEVLTAINKSERVVDMDSLGRIRSSFFRNNFSDYDLSKPFSDQSEDFYSFLLEIIK